MSDSVNENRQQRNILIHYLNSEILGIYIGISRLKDPVVYQAIVHLTKYSFLLSEGPLIIPAAYLFEFQFIDAFLKNIKPIIDARLLYISSPTNNLEEYAEKKRWEYRDQLPLFPEYESKSSRKNKLFKDFVWLPRITRSASKDISKVWNNSINNGNSFWIDLLSKSTLRTVSLNKLEKAIESVPKQLDGRAFIYKHVSQLLPVNLPPRFRTQISLLISRGYLESYLEEFDAIALVDTPIGLLDCGLNPLNIHGRLRTISFRDFRKILNSLNISQYIDSFLNWSSLIELREHFVFKWLINHIIADSVQRKTNLEKAIRLSRIKMFINTLGDSPKSPLQILYDYLDEFYGKVGPYLGEDLSNTTSHFLEKDINEYPHNKSAEKYKQQTQQQLFESITEVKMKSKSRSILFMDVAGWSKLSMIEIQSYVINAMPKVSKILEEKEAETVNTWGDTIVATFDSAASAAECALNIREFFKKSLPTDGIATGLTCRVSLHLGEVLQGINPITGKSDIFGSAVHLAARLEPVTNPGQVFCSHAFETVKLFRTRNSRSLVYF